MTQEEFSLLFHRAKVNYVAFRQLYEPVAFEAMHRMVEMAIAEEREACAKVCEDKAMRLETKAQEAIEAGEHGEVNAIRSTAWQISVCAAEIRARGQELRKGEHG